MSENQQKAKTAKGKRGISYYFRVDTKTIQGKITGAFLLVALVATIMLVINSSTWRIVNNDYAFIVSNITPAKLALSKIKGSVIGTDNLAQQLVNTSKEELNQSRIQIWEKTIIHELDNLNQSASDWNNPNSEAYLTKLNAELKEWREIQNEAVSNRDQNTIESNRYKDLHQSISFLCDQLTKELAELEITTLTNAEKIKQNISLLLIIEYIIAFLISTLVASAILVNVLKKVKFLKVKIREMAEGNLPDEIPGTADEMNAIITALNEMVVNLRSITHFASEVGEGKFDSEITVFNNSGDLGKSLAEMRDSLKNVAEEDKKRVWFNEGIAIFGDIQRNNNQEIDALTAAFMGELVKYLKVVQGSIFIVQADDSNDVHLKMMASYAFDRRKYHEKTLLPGQGLVGQSYLEKDIMHLTEIPEEYINVRSGLGDSSPTNLLIVPMMVNEDVVGVIELASFHPFLDNVIDFVKRVAENLAATIQTVQMNEETKKLLEESQIRAEQMQAQEEEMRQNMEEMQATQEELNRKNMEVEKNNAESSSILKGINAMMATIEFTPAGEILNANKNFLQSMKYSLSEIAGQHHSMFVLEEEANSADYRDFWKSLADGKSKSGTFKRVDANKEVVMLNAMYTPIFDASDRVVKVIKLATVIS